MERIDALLAEGDGLVQAGRLNTATVGEHIPQNMDRLWDQYRAKLARDPNSPEAVRLAERDAFLERVAQIDAAVQAQRAGTVPVAILRPRKGQLVS